MWMVEARVLRVQIQQVRVLRDELSFECWHTFWRKVLCFNCFESFFFKQFRFLPMSQEFFNLVLDRALIHPRNTLSFEGISDRCVNMLSIFSPNLPTNALLSPPVLSAAREIESTTYNPVSLSSGEHFCRNFSIENTMFLYSCLMSSKTSLDYTWVRPWWWAESWKQRWGVWIRRAHGAPCQNVKLPCLINSFFWKEIKIVNCDSWFQSLKSIIIQLTILSD